MGKKVLFINQEMTPYVPKTDMAYLGQNMPLKMQGAGYEIRTFMPKWGIINERRGQLHEVIRLSGMNLIIDDTDHPLIIKVASIPGSRIQVYFIDNDDYFHSRTTMTQDENGHDYPDNGERAIFFTRGVLETVKKLRWAPDYIVCQGWMTSIIPFYIKNAYKDEPQFAESKIITSLFADQPEGNFGDNLKEILPFKGAKASLLKNYPDKFNAFEFQRLALDYSDAVVAVGDVPASLLDYAKQSNLPMMTHPTDENAVKEAYKNFFESL